MTRMRALTFSCQRTQLEHAFEKITAATNMNRCQRQGDGVWKRLDAIGQSNTAFLDPRLSDRAEHHCAIAADARCRSYLDVVPHAAGQ